MQGIKIANRGFDRIGERTIKNEPVSERVHLIFCYIDKVNFKLSFRRRSFSVI